MPSIVEKPTATRSNNLQWSGMCIKMPLDSDVSEEDLEVLIAFNGSNTQAHYVSICKPTPELNFLHLNYRPIFTFKYRLLIHYSFNQVLGIFSTLLIHYSFKQVQRKSNL